MTFSPSWYTQHPDEEKTPVSLANISLEQFDGVIAKNIRSNEEKTFDAIRQADSASFIASNPWLKLTKTNTKLINNWLENQKITWPQYADFAAATEALCGAGLLDVEEALYVQHLDGNGPKTFKGAFTKRVYNSLDDLISNERQACIEAQAADKPTDLERAFNTLPIEGQQQMLRDAEKQSQANADSKVSAANADSWLTLHPEFRDDEYNGRLLLSQLKANGVTGVVTIADYERAERQIVASGLVRQNPAQLKKIQAQEVLDRAARAVNEPGSIFDKTSEADMYALPLDELRRRAAGNFTGSDRF